MEENSTHTNDKQPEINEKDSVQKEETAEKSEVENLGEKVTELEKQTAQLKDQLLRKAAEFENYKRRTESESMNFARYASESALTQLLPVLDDLSRSLQSVNDTKAEDPFYKGIEMIQTKFLKILESQGLKPMETVGKEFNVDYHDALMQVPRNDVPPHTIIEEVEKGYLLFDKVIRHAKVIVSTSAVEEEIKD